jgi:glycosyltransferase involved in cell wall biosynthesis
MDQIKDLIETPYRTILIVDDDQETCALLESFFQSSGYTAKSAYNSEEALAYLETNEPDAIVMYVTMPDMDGWEIFTRIRSHCDVPVLFLKAMASGTRFAHTLHLDDSYFTRKPFTLQESLLWSDALLKTLVPKRDNTQEIAGMSKIKCSMAITVVIPAYNETRFIGSTVLKARAYADTVIVVDDGSSDNTAEVAEAAGAVLVRHNCNLGKGAALNTGFCKARELGAQVVVTLDADGQHLAEELPQVVKPVLAGEADVVIGSRYISPHSDVPRHRIWGHWFFNQLIRVGSGVSVTDSQSGYRAFSSAALEAITFNSNGFSVESEMQFIAHEKGLRLMEVPITILYTDKPKRSVIKHGLFVLGGVLKLVGQYRPLFFFGLPGVIIMLSAFSCGIGVVSRFLEVGQLPIGFAMVSLLLAVVGTVLFSIGIILHSIRGILNEMLNSKKMGKG